MTKTDKTDLESLKNWIQSKGFEKMDVWFMDNVKYNWDYAELIEPITMGLNPEETTNDLDAGYVEACINFINEINKRLQKSSHKKGEG